MVGMEIDRPIINDKALKYNFTNEGGVEGRIDFHKNIMGLWIIQECRRQWEKEGNNIGFAEMCEMAHNQKSNSLIDTDDPSFFLPRRHAEAGKENSEKNKSERTCNRW